MFIAKASYIYRNPFINFCAVWFIDPCLLLKHMTVGPRLTDRHRRTAHSNFLMNVFGDETDDVGPREI